MTDVAKFYDDLASHYHLLLEDWEQTIESQQAALAALMEEHLGKGPKRILDAACGIGTQVIGFSRGAASGSDLSPVAVRRAKRELAARGLKATLRVADLRMLSGYHAGPFDVVAALDNALLHLESEEDMAAAMREMASLLAPGGLFLVSVSDCVALSRKKPRSSEPKVFGGGDLKRIVFQVLDWRRDERGYRVHQYILQHGESGQLDARVFTTCYWTWPRHELERILGATGLTRSRWLEPHESGFFQPLLLARSG